MTEKPPGYYIITSSICDLPYAYSLLQSFLYGIHLHSPISHRKWLISNTSNVSNFLALFAYVYTGTVSTLSFSYRTHFMNS